MSSAIVKLKDGKTYKVSIPKLFEKNVVMGIIKKGNYAIDANSKSIVLSYNDQKIKLIITNHQESENGWFRVGKLSEIEDIVKTFSPLKYDFGLTYNGSFGQPRPVFTTTWNRGIRIFFKHNYPQGDGANMAVGNSIFKRKTDDWNEEEAGKKGNKNFFLHKYVKVLNGQYFEYVGNGYLDLALFAKKM